MRQRRLASDEAHSWARHQHLGNPLAKLLLVMLAGYVNADGECWVGLRTLAEDCDCDRKTIVGRLDWLHARGLISRKRQWLSDNGDRNSEGRGKPTTDLIRLNIDVENYSAAESEKVPNGPLNAESDAELAVQLEQKKFQTDRTGPVSGPVQDWTAPIRQRSVSGPIQAGPVNEPEPEEERRAGARAREARAPGRPAVAATPALDDPPEWVGCDTRHWFALENYFKARNDAQGMRCINNPAIGGEGRFRGKLGFPFKRSVIMAALHHCAGWTYKEGIGLYPSTGPPASISATRRRGRAR